MSFGVNTFQKYRDDSGLGHNGVAVSLNYYDGLPESSLLNSLSSNELKLIFKSLMKRDDTTKEKALNELMGLVEHYDHNSFLFDDIMLLCWSQLYAKLCMSELKNIRLVCQQVTLGIITKMRKSVAKYFKDLIPFVLLGTCDTDSAVARLCATGIKTCFNDDEDKVTALYSLFDIPILSLTKAILVTETPQTLTDERYSTPDDADFKYQRVVVSAINLLLAAIERNKAILEDETFNEIMDNENLWKLMSIKNLNSIKTYESLIRLAITLSEEEFLTCHKHVLKLISKKLLKSLSQFNDKNILKVNYICPLILTLFMCLNKYKNGKFWSYDKISKDRLVGFLSTAMKSPTVGFFPTFFRFYTSVESQDILDKELEWWPLIRIGNKNLCNKSFLGRDGAKILKEYWSCRVQLNNSSFSNKNELLIEDIKEVINSTDITNVVEVKQLFRNYLNNTAILHEIDVLLASHGNLTRDIKLKFDNFLNLFFLEATESDVISMSKTLIKAWDNKEGPPESTLFVSNRLIKNGKEHPESLYFFFERLLDLMNEDNHSEISNLFVSYSSIIKVPDEKVISLFGSFIMRVTIISKNVNSVKDILCQIPRIYCEKLCSADESTIKKIFDTIIQSYSGNTNVQFFQSPIINIFTIHRLFEVFVSKGEFSKLVSDINYLDSTCKQYLYAQETFYDHTLNELNDMQFFTLLKEACLVLGVNDEIDANIVKVLLRKIKKSFSKQSSEQYFEVLDILLKHNKDTINVFLPSDPLKLLKEFNPSSLLLCDGNFGANVAFFLSGPTLEDYEKAKPLLHQAMFIDTYLSKNNKTDLDAWIIFLTIMSEIAADYNYLSESPEYIFQDLENTIYKSVERPFSFLSILNLLNNVEAKNNSWLSKLIDFEESNSMVAYYSGMIVRRILINEVDYMNSSDKNFISQELYTFLSKALREKEHGLKLFYATILLATSKDVVMPEAFVKVGALLISQIVGISEMELIKGKSKVLLILFSMLAGSINISEPVLPIPKLNMALKTLDNILDSDIAYDEEFIIHRLLIMKFIGAIVSQSNLEQAHSQALKLAERLIADGFSMSLLEETPMKPELQYLATQLHKYCIARNEWECTEEYRSEIETGFMDTMLNSVSVFKNNHCSAQYYIMCEGIFSARKTNEQIKNLDSMIEQLVSMQLCCNIGYMRLLVAILEKTIYEKQQINLIEFELENQKLGKDKTQDDNQEDERNFEEYKIPEILMTSLITNLPSEYLEYENQYRFLNYLWTWYLTVSYFKDVSYNMRELYMDQLKEKDLITQMLDFIVDQIDFDDTTYWKTVEINDISNYEIHNNQLEPFIEAVNDECKKLLVHLMYKIFSASGTLSAKWYMNIKNKSLSSKIDRFVSEFVSPILISNELREVENKKESLTSKDDSLTIKINEKLHEVKASFLIDEQKLEIAFKLPVNYPLENIQVIGISRVGISEQKWKQWIMSTQHVITGMNGSVQDSLELFTKNVGLQFSGFEECAICYSILHAVDRKLPTKTCSTCKNKFHGACLYKWFRSSGNNTCPLCRSEINFRR